MVEALIELCHDLEVPTPKSYGIDHATWDRLTPLMAEQAIASGSPANNPVVPTPDDIERIYSRSTAEGAPVAVRGNARFLFTNGHPGGMDTSFVAAVSSSQSGSPSRRRVGVHRSPDDYRIPSNRQYLWIKIFYAASSVAVVSSGRSTSLPFSNFAPARTSATRWGALTARQRDWAASISL